VKLRAIDRSIYHFASNALSTIDVSVAEKQHFVLRNLDNAMDNEGVSGVCHHHIVFADVALAEWAQGDGRSAAEKWQHTLAIDRNAHAPTLEQHIAGSGKEFSVWNKTTLRHTYFLYIVE
jgi:hypothetical protein